VNYRQAYGMHASNGILFNHESPIRGETFVTRKITRAVARIALGLQDILYLGNLSARRDWGHAKDYIKAMYLILQQPAPDDYVIATGVMTSIREMATKAFAHVGIELDFIGQGADENAVVRQCRNDLYKLPVGKKVIAVDQKYFRPTEVDALLGDATKARTRLGWQPEYDIDALVSEMVDADLRLMRREQFLKNNGYEILNYFE
jgi:GDPmannose 4,6-dehydratase